MRWIQIVLSRRGTSILFTLISVIAINSWQQVLGNFDYDNSFTIAAAKNISEGHGYTIQTVSTEDISRYYYDPLNRWPPGYSGLLVIAHWLFNIDWIHTSYILNAIGLTLLILVFRKILSQLEFPVWIVNVAVLYYGFLYHPFHFSYFSDIFGLLFFLSGLIMLLGAVKSDQHVFINSILSAFFLGGSVYMKYLYIPLSFAPLISLYIYGYCLKKNNLQRAAISGFSLLILIVVSLMVFQFNNSGHTLYVNPSKTGFYLDQLLNVAPVIPLGFINLTFLDVQLNRILHISFESLNVFWKVINIFCISWLARISYKMIRQWISGFRSFRAFYALNAMLFTIILFVTLVVLTIVKSKHYSDTFFDWVYGQELRYYAVFIVFILQFATFLFLRQEHFFNNTTRIIFRLLIGLILIIEITHGTYFCIKKIFIEKEYGMAIESDQYLFRSMELVKREMKNNKRLVICSNNYAIANICSLEDIPIFCEIGKLQKSLSSSLSVRLIIAADTSVPGISVPFLRDPVVKPDLVFKNVSYYIVNLPKTNF